MATSEQLVTALCAPPVAIATAIRPPELGGIPDAPGLYSWWTTEEDALPGVPAQPVPGRSEYLLYVGISPSTAASNGSLRHRVRTHVRGNIGASTFRLSLASLLWQEQGWQPEWRSDRALLSREDNEALSAWQADHLRVVWAVQPDPWSVEHHVISTLKPPMNLASNAAHPFYAQLITARARLRDEARRYSGGAG